MTPLNRVRGWPTIRLQILKRDNYQCQIRGPACTTHATHVDHITPRSSNGSHDPANLRAACANCNLQRGDGRNRRLNYPSRKWLG